MKLSPFAKRISHVFKLLTISVKDFAENSSLGLSTLYRWKNSTEDKLPDEGILQILCDALFNEGIVCDLSWLVSGSGMFPYHLANNPLGAHLEGYSVPSKWKLHRSSTEEKSIFKALKRLQATHSETSTPLLFRFRAPYSDLGARAGNFLVATETKVSEKVRDDIIIVENKSGAFYPSKVVKDSDGNVFYLTESGSTLSESDITRKLYLAWVGFI